MGFLHNEASVETLGMILVKHETSKWLNNKAHIIDGMLSKCCWVCHSVPCDPFNQNSSGKDCKAGGGWRLEIDSIP